MTAWWSTVTADARGNDSSALQAASGAADRTVPSDARRTRTETEYLLMVDYLGRNGVFGSERRDLPRGTTEAGAINAAQGALETADRVEIFSREVPAEWTKVEEFNRGRKDPSLP